MRTRFDQVTNAEDGSRTAFARALLNKVVKLVVAGPELEPSSAFPPRSPILGLQLHSRRSELPGEQQPHQHHRRTRVFWPHCAFRHANKRRKRAQWDGVSKWRCSQTTRRKRQRRGRRRSRGDSPLPPDLRDRKGGTREGGSCQVDNIPSEPLASGATQPLDSHRPGTSHDSGTRGRNVRSQNVTCNRDDGLTPPGSAAGVR